MTDFVRDGGGFAPPRKSRYVEQTSRPRIDPRGYVRDGRPVPERYARWPKLADDSQPFARTVILLKSFTLESGDYYHNGRHGRVPSERSSAWKKWRVKPDSGMTLVFFWPEQVPVIVRKSSLALVPSDEERKILG